MHGLMADYVNIYHIIRDQESESKEAYKTETAFKILNNC